MFEAKLPQAATLKKVVDAIKDLVQDAPFDCSETGMSLQAMDSSHVALVSLKMDVSLFDTYRCDRTINVGLSLATMAKALKCANNDDSCHIRHDDDDHDNVTFTFKDAKKERTQEVTVRLVDLDNEHLGIPEQEYSVVLQMPSSDFMKTCKDLSMFSDTLCIAANKSSIEFSATGDNGSSKVTYNKSSSLDDDEENGGGIVLEVKTPVKINFSIKYMNQFTKATPLGEVVKISMCNGVPVIVEYPFGSDDRSSLSFFLAPKIDDDVKMEA
ncbi:Proliferating cell nuclear antigen [Strongyloides ratti]|uniref:DNA sliding clamp PCNA n=1 Tax=Strongyloides ratti TaxID=34506 RepID=A0A090L171_STRRB|nr:Proliferating cell nuclear antigen [Strongyloides ratti]CEF63451.1 Proliferating cell nuclear antigen [Strongyloides ratti]